MYEFLIATGKSKNADTNKDVEMALIYNDSGSEVISDYFYPGRNSNRTDAYEKGQLDICSNIEITKNGTKVATENFVGVMIKFHGGKWQCDYIWVTHQIGGRCRSKRVNMFLGKDVSGDIGTVGNPLRVDLDTGPQATTKRDTVSFAMTVRTSTGSNSGTNDNVFFKLFDDTGYASETSRGDQIGNQYESGATDTIPSFKTWYGPLSKNITKIIIIKVGSDGWKPEHILVTEVEVLGGTSNQFEVLNYLPEGNLDTHHNWTSVPSS